MLCETISNFVHCHNYFSMYVGLCICSYMHLVELWTVTNKYTMVYHISCHRLPWYTILTSLVNGVVFMLCEWIPDVNSRCDFSMYVAVFICSYMDLVKLCTETKIHTVIFFRYMRHHAYNGKQHCQPWSTMSCAYAMFTFPFYNRVINFIRMWLCTYVHLCNHNNFALCTNANAIVTGRFTIIPADVYHGKLHSVLWWTMSCTEATSWNPEFY